MPNPVPHQYFYTSIITAIQHHQPLSV